MCTEPSWLERRIAARLTSLQSHVVPENLIERPEVVALLFNVSDIAITLTSIERLLTENEDNGEEEADEG